MGATVSNTSRNNNFVSKLIILSTDNSAANVGIKASKGHIVIHSGTKAYEKKDATFSSVLFVRNGDDLEFYASIVPTESVDKTDPEWFQVLDENDNNPFTEVESGGEIAVRFAFSIDKNA